MQEDAEELWKYSRRPAMCDNTEVKYKSEWPSALYAGNER
jgi:hypothetical protein